MKKQNLSSTIFSVAAIVLGMFLNVAAAKESPIVRFDGKKRVAAPERPDSRR